MLVLGVELAAKLVCGLPEFQDKAPRFAPLDCFLGDEEVLAIIKRGSVRLSLCELQDFARERRGLERKEDQVKGF